MTDTRVRQKWHNLLEGPDLFATRLSRVIHYSLIVLILANSVAVIIGSEPLTARKYSTFFRVFEILSILVFTLEYVARIWVAAEKNPDQPWKARFRYFWTPYALIDLAVLLPFYLGSLLGIDLRVLRMLRLIRILKFLRYFSGLKVLVRVLRAEAGPMSATLLIIIMLIVIAATGMFIAENHAQPDKFGSIAETMWWATVTLTTVGYGDVVPITWVGQIMAAVIMILGVGIVALPAGMLAARFSSELHERERTLLARAESFAEDGDITPSELQKLDNLRAELSLPRDDLDRVEDLVDIGDASDSNTCPACGQPLPDANP